jgi:hypothetical protein
LFVEIRLLSSFVGIGIEVRRFINALNVSTGVADNKAQCDVNLRLAPFRIAVDNPEISLSLVVTGALIWSV